MKERMFTLMSRLLKVRAKLFCLLTFIFVVHAGVFAQSANILITPGTSNISTTGSFTVNVRVDMQTGSCNAAEVHLNFNTAFLRITNITRPSSATFTSETIALPVAPYTAVNSSGHLEYAAGIPTGSTSADFDILAITFSPPVSSPQLGSTSITLQNTPGHRTRTAFNGTPLSGTLTGATANILNCTPPSATIAAASSSCNAQPVGLVLSSATGTGPYSLTVNGITYNNVTVGSTFTPSPIAFPSFNIWPSTNPSVTTQNDGNSIETGVKFRSTQAGFIKGVRMYTGNTVTGTFKGKLWNFSTGALMATANYAAVGVNGWQEVSFATPVFVSANTTYIATMYSSAGNYVASPNFFSSAVTNGPLTALANATSSNGIFFLGAEQAGPTTSFGSWQTFQSTNYWVDVVFAQNTNTFNLTSVTDNTACTSSGGLQTLNVTSTDCSTLPVTLLNLSATPQGKKVILKWSTSSESNNLGFDVQRSRDGVNWTTLNFVEGAGNSSDFKNYIYPDENLNDGRYYYRLKQIDIDQRFKYSSIVSATIGSKVEYVLGQNFPNPFRGETTIQYTLPKAGQVNLSLFDISGRSIKTLVNSSKEAGTHAINFNAGLLNKGVYYYRIQVGDFTDVKKLVIQ